MHRPMQTAGLPSVGDIRYLDVEAVIWQGKGRGGEPNQGHLDENSNSLSTRERWTGLERVERKKDAELCKGDEERGGLRGGGQVARC